jgi:hypothetical protein
MKKTALFWVIAILITVSAAIYQRMTGPTYPIKGKTLINDSEIAYKLERSHESTMDYKIAIEVKNEEITGHLMYKRHKTDDPRTKIPFIKKGNSLVASLPKQPPAGKLEYEVILSSQMKETSLTGGKPIIIRFKGPVPSTILQSLFPTSSSCF